MALHSLAIRTTSISPLDTTPSSSTTPEDISLRNVSQLYELSESTNAMSLRRACILFLLEQFDKLRVKPWYGRLMRRIAPDVMEFFKSLLASGTDKK
ncbi:hypothetical protein K1719_011313 [Acacia pycnantha]|nr:hypothetical protein K1719_011313 [Acacia pycnantha]